VDGLAEASPAGRLKMPFFDAFFDQQPTSLGRWLQVHKARQVLRRLKRHHGRIEKLLEIGPGWGELADLCIGAGIHYLAVEANETRAVLLQQRGLAVALTQAPPLPLSSAQFDAVVALNVLEHMPELGTAIHFLAEMARVARPDGIVCVNSPDLLATGSGFWDADYTHNYPVTARRLSQMYRDLDLEIVDAAYFSGPILGPLATPISWLARLVPAGLPGLIGGSSPIWERVYRTRLTFLRNVFVIGRKTIRNLQQRGQDDS
jgi:SAM-dependent methyltransferase